MAFEILDMTKNMVTWEMFYQIWHMGCDVPNILPYLEFLKRYVAITYPIVKFQLFWHAIWFYLAGK